MQIASSAATAVIAVVAVVALWEWHQATIAQKNAADELTAAQDAQKLATTQRDMAQKGLQQLSNISDTLVYDMAQDPRYTVLPKDLLTQMFDRAIEGYTVVINMDPTYAEAYNGRGSALHDESKLDQALDDFNKAI